MIEDNATRPLLKSSRRWPLRGSAGDRLPSVRELMRRHRVAPATVQRAIGSLAARGLVEARPGRGTFVARRAAAPAAPDVAWQTVALGARAPDAGALDELLRPAPPGALVLSAGYLPPSCSRSARSGRRSPAPRGGPARGTGCRSRASPRCAPTSRPRWAGARAPATC